MVTSRVWSNYVHNSKAWDISPANSVTPLFKSLWPSTKDDHNSEFPLYQKRILATFTVTSLVLLLCTDVELAPETTIDDTRGTCAVALPGIFSDVL